MNNFSELNIEITKFLKWSYNIDFHENSSEWKSNYPDMHLIYEKVNKTIELINISKDETEIICGIELLIQCIGFDDEVENIVTLCFENLVHIEYLIKLGYMIGTEDARWQIASRLPGVEENNLKWALIYCNDKDKYVQRRALISLNSINQEEAKSIAKTKVNDSDVQLSKLANDVIKGKI